MTTARVNGIQIDYQDTARGRTIFLTHGHLSGRTAWYGQHRALAYRYRAISRDRPGHVQADSPDDPRDPRPGGRDGHRRVTIDRGAHAGDRRRSGHAVPGAVRVHRQEDPRRAPGDDRGRRPLVEPGSAR